LTVTSHGKRSALKKWTASGVPGPAIAPLAACSRRRRRRLGEEEEDGEEKDKPLSLEAGRLRAAREEPFGEREGCGQSEAVWVPQST
jgi:hypothetical protein